MTTVLTWQVRPGGQEQFEKWTRGITRCARRFPGNEGVSWLRPEEGHRYHAVLRWTDHRRLAAWLESPERARWHARIEDVATEIGSERQSTTGMETWFALPGTTVQAPPRWKMVLTTFLGAYPLTLLIQWLVAPRTADWPLPLRAAVFPLVLLPVLTYVVMPRLSKLLRQWLYRVPGTRVRGGPDPG
ncbi:antibiotic biosynthesis monooxygenase [Streptomyces ziwulingensis]|uniref:Antibiotic biosynthesis monooxygenase n=1 Tax=Streptomyces ziwulingensis TaxID=1045501 RepID=A0ABP9B5Y1_9ACTN